jgi:hypothetical protein
MGAAAVAVRARIAGVRRGDRARVCGLTFERPGGPLVAVAGLAGGAGTTTLALLLARQAARESTAPVLVTELSAERPGLAVLAGRAGRISLPELARRVADGDLRAEPFLEIEPGLRLIASTPAVQPPAAVPELDALLDQARDAHGLVVIDCGSDSVAARPVLERATHIIWTLPASVTCVASAHLLLTSTVLPPAGGARELLVGVARDGHATVRVRALRRLAHMRCERLVLVPYSPALARGDAVAAGEITSALTGLASALRRTR